MFTLLEREIIERSLTLVGYSPMPEADGILSPGGSLSNMYGMVLARYHYFPEVKRKGMSGLPPLGVFTSEDGHYSITKGAHWLGIGTDYIFKVFHLVSSYNDIKGSTNYRNTIPGQIGRARAYGRKRFEVQNRGSSKKGLRTILRKCNFWHNSFGGLRSA